MKSDMSPVIRDASTDGEIARCYPVMRQLRPHLIEAEFVPTVRRQIAEGYLLAYLEDEGQVYAVAGYRITENLASGRFLYVDDLVTDAAARSRGYGARLLAWLEDRARAAGCQSLQLDSGVQRFDAHRFYHVQRMTIASHHFRMDLTAG
jgi:GNAT superfamily N-acetyltransferase